MGLLTWAITGVVVGLIANQIKGKVVDIGLGKHLVFSLIGAYLGGFLMNLMLGTSSLISSNIPGIHFAVIIAVIFIAIVRHRESKKVEEMEKKKIVEY